MQLMITQKVEKMRETLETLSNKFKLFKVATVYKEATEVEQQFDEMLVKLNKLEIKWLKIEASCTELYSPARTLYADIDELKKLANKLANSIKKKKHLINFSTKREIPASIRKLKILENSINHRTSLIASMQNNFHFIQNRSEFLAMAKESDTLDILIWHEKIINLHRDKINEITEEVTVLIKEMSLIMKDFPISFSLENSSEQFNAAKENAQKAIDTCGEKFSEIYNQYTKNNPSPVVNQKLLTSIVNISNTELKDKTQEAEITYFDRLQHGFCTYKQCTSENSLLEITSENLANILHLRMLLQSKIDDFNPIKYALHCYKFVYNCENLAQFLKEFFLDDIDFLMKHFPQEATLKSYEQSTRQMLESLSTFLLRIEEQSSFDELDISQLNKLKGFKLQSLVITHASPHQFILKDESFSLYDLIYPIVVSKGLITSLIPDSKANTNLKAKIISVLFPNVPKKSKELDKESETLNSLTKFNNQL